MYNSTQQGRNVKPPILDGRVIAKYQDDMNRKS